MFIFIFIISTYKCYDYAQKKKKKYNAISNKRGLSVYEIIYAENFKRRPPEELIDVLADYR